MNFTIYRFYDDLLVKHYLCMRHPALGFQPIMPWSFLPSDYDLSIVELKARFK